MRKLLILTVLSLATLVGNIGTSSAQAKTSQYEIIKHNYLVSKHTIAWFNGPGRWSLFPRYDKCGNIDRAKIASLCARQRHKLNAHSKRYERLDAILHPKTDWLYDAFMCIHRYEGAWNAVSNSTPTYYGGLQMDIGFQSRYGSDYLKRWGTANNWPAWAQIEAAKRAYRSGRGFYPWPNTAQVCGLL